MTSGNTTARAYPDFLLAALERAACAVFCKENRMEFATSPTLTGNPGQPRDLRFSQVRSYVTAMGESALAPEVVVIVVGSSGIQTLKMVPGLSHS